MERDAVDINEVWHRFRFHPADTEAKRKAHEQMRSLHGELATELHKHLPEGREKSLAMTKLEEALFWANASIARHRHGSEK